MEAAVVQPVVEVNEVVAASADQREWNGEDFTDLVVTQSNIC